MTPRKLYPARNSLSIAIGDRFMAPRDTPLWRRLGRLTTAREWKPKKRCGRRPDGEVEVVPRPDGDLERVRIHPATISSARSNAGVVALDGTRNGHRPN